MSTEEREESQPRPRKVIPSIRRENTDQEGERRPYNQGYNRPEGNNYERRPYDRPSRDDRGGYNSYGDNRSSYGDRPSRPRTYDNREGGGYNSSPSYNNRGGYGNNREGGYGNNREGGYNSNREGGYNSRPSYGNNRPSYGNNDRSYGGGGSYNRPALLMETTIVLMAVVSTVLLVLTMTKDRAEPILLLRKGMLQATA